MAEPQQAAKAEAPSPSLSDRVLGYRLEVEKVVRDVGEHPLYEFKRSCSTQDLTDKIEFVKEHSINCNLSNRQRKVLGNWG